MSYKPGEQELMAYLYGELEGADRVRVEQYFLTHPEAKAEFEKLSRVSGLLGTIKDKEVIAPPIFLGDPKRDAFWQAPYFRTVISIAASLLIVVLVARLVGTNVTVTGNEFRLSFGPTVPVQPVLEQPASSVTMDDVQKMINQSLQANNTVLNTSWEESQAKLEKSISQNLVMNSGKMNDIVRQASSATKDQVQQYVSTLQSENMKMVKDYFALSSGEQKQYIEEMLVDFAKYLQQQRENDLQLVQMRMNKIEQNTNVFQEETEQILTSIISSVGNAEPAETKY